VVKAGDPDHVVDVVAIQATGRSENRIILFAYFYT